jgi:hypothetical protein
MPTSSICSLPIKRSLRPHKQPRKFPRIRSSARRSYSIVAERVFEAVFAALSTVLFGAPAARAVNLQVAPVDMVTGEKLRGEIPFHRNCPD